MLDDQGVIRWPFSGQPPSEFHRDLDQIIRWVPLGYARAFRWDGVGVGATFGFLADLGYQL